MSATASNSAPAAGLSGGSAAAAVAAVLLPPLCVLMLKGVGRDFWIAIGLTCLGYVPGLAFALWTLLRTRAVPAGDTRP